MAVDPDTVFFFVHLMKTGGTTFAQHIDRNFPVGARYPTAPKDGGRDGQYFMIDEVRAEAARRGRELRCYTGHLPFVVSDLVGADVRLTIVRDPVERTVSALRHFRRYHEEHRDRPLEAIYEDPFVFDSFVHDHQSKLFAMTVDDKLESHLDVVTVDEDRLRVAIDNLERTDVVGLTDGYAAFLDQLADRYGWEFDAVPDLRVSREDWHVPAGFERRILADNAADVAFYEHAVRLAGVRGGTP
jgi:Sulfotransferase family